MKHKILILIILFLAITTSGCVSFKSGKKDTSSIDGGVFKTYNKGANWQQKILIPTVKGRPGNFASLNFYSMSMDPSDRKAIYFGSVNSGLLYTYDGGDNWRQANGLSGTIRAVAVDPNSKCIIYTTIGNKVYKSNDCNRTWHQVYYDNVLNTTVDAVAIDHYNSSVIYIGVSRGDLIKSYDMGEGWQTIHRFNNKIEKIIIDPNESRTIYVVTNKKGVFRSFDSGDNWHDLNKILKELKIGLNVKDLIFIKNEPGKIFLATPQGIVRSDDNAETWEKIKLIPPENKATVNAITINPKNTKEIYYVTNTTFNRSLDGGENWTPTKLPTSRFGRKLIIDPEEPNVIYMGVFRIIKK